MIEPISQPTGAETSAPQSVAKRLDGRIIFSILISLAIAVLAYSQRHEVFEAFQLLRGAHLGWIGLAFAIILVSFFSAANVYDRALRATGHKLKLMRLWATAIVAILLSQAIPAGGIASCAFLVESFRRKGVSVAHASFVMMMEVLSYVGAMLVFLFFGIFFVIFHSKGEIALGSSIAAGAVALGVVAGAVFLITRPDALLKRWMLAWGGPLMRLVGKPWGDEQVGPILHEVGVARSIIVNQWPVVILLTFIQMLTFTGHSIALMVVLWSMGVEVSFFVVAAAFGIALITGTFNVLPGGGGTVETILALTLTQLGVAGNQAIAGAVIFRMLNFWVLLPIAFFFYQWLMRGQSAPINPRSE
jgi:uncharacterized protein (TIRG00374 family)